jgi:hypothetical protein
MRLSVRLSDRKGSEAARIPSTSKGAGVGANGTRAESVERRHGWSGGKSSEGLKPKDDSGVKNRHEAAAG